MIGHVPVGADFVPGARFVIGAERHPGPTFVARRTPELVLEVVSVAGTSVTATDHLGGVHRFQAVWNSPPRFDEGRSVMWMGPLPHGSPEEILAMAAALLVRDARYRHNRTLLLFVDGAADGGAVARLVMPVGADREGWHSHEPVAGTEYGAAFVPDAPIAVASELLDGIVLPALVAVNGYEAGPEWDDPSIVKGTFARVATLADLDAVGRWMPEHVVRKGFITDGNPMGIGGVEEIDYETSRAIARNEPDELIVVAVARDGSPHEVDASHMSATGIKLHDVDTIDDSLWSFPEGEGIWLGSQIGWYDGGEDGWDWDAVWTRATAADLARHDLTLDDVVEHVSDRLERDVRPDLVAGWLAPSEEGAPAP